MANRPDNTAFTQQQLPAWQPILSAGIVIPGFTLIGLAFIGVGVALFVTSQNIKVLEVGWWCIVAVSLNVLVKNQVYAVLHLPQMWLGCYTFG